jgi:hypothetical protein
VISLGDIKYILLITYYLISSYNTTGILKLLDITDKINDIYIHTTKKTNYKKDAILRMHRIIIETAEEEQILNRRMRRRSLIIYKK